MHSYEAGRVCASLLASLATTTQRHPETRDTPSSPNSKIPGAFTASTIGQRDFAGRHLVPPPHAYSGTMVRFGSSVAEDRK
ncbi:hypothetical protein TIFTF001_018109 [Ficus carica]|uniref:Uncharacterized protein n=1 Tax=Ficus carica TaxID=3494 RepID=A0AA88DJ58_FICCA|nr:hypothetical protein TIFTF001_018109 [Ficus carica]